LPRLGKIATKTSTNNNLLGRRSLYLKKVKFTSSVLYSTMRVCYHHIAVLVVAQVDAFSIHKSNAYTSRKSSPVHAESKGIHHVDDHASSAIKQAFLRPSLSRKQFLGAATAMGLLSGISSVAPASAASAALQDSLDVDNFLRTGVDPSGNMGVSSQAGKSRPVTGVVLRDGSEVNQDPSGTVLAEILVGTKANPKAVLASFSTPLPLARGTVFDVECRDQKTGDGAFLAVTKSTGGKSIDEIPSSFFTERLFDPTGRFSFYGSPTDIKIKSSKVDAGYRTIELSFSNLSQSTNAEIPRRAILVATIVPGTDNAVCFVASANAARWNKGSEAVARKTVESFRATAAPKSNLKLRAKDRGQGTIDF
jgi:hypothetical protein